MRFVSSPGVFLFLRCVFVVSGAISEKNSCYTVDVLFYQIISFLYKVHRPWSQNQPLAQKTHT